jgi:tripartite-type tricarboxylate transporter receptor subunit TctC
MQRAAFNRLLLGAIGAALSGLPARAQQDFPTRPVRLISGFAPGGGTDILGRLVAQRFGESWRNGMIVENRSGASGVVGATFAARAPADGYTLLLMPNSQTITQHVQRNSGFDVQRDLTPVGMIATAPLVLSVHGSLPVRSVAELVAYARANPSRVNHGSAGTATAPHLAGELFNIMAGTQMEHVPYRGSGPMVLA